MNEKNLLVPIPIDASASGYHHAIIGILLKAANTPQPCWLSGEAVVGNYILEMGEGRY